MQVVVPQCQDPHTLNRGAMPFHFITSDYIKRVVPGIYSYIYCDDYYFNFRPGTKTEIIIVTINVKVNPELRACDILEWEHGC
jgi:hypothetical protein